MLKNAATLVALILLFCLLVFLNPFGTAKGEELVTSSVETSVDCIAELPDVAYMGEGSGEYTLPLGYNVFIVKRHNGHFYVENGPVYDSPGPKDEWIYACFGTCDQFSKLEKSHIRLGERQAGEVVNIMVLDHKTTGKPHWWSHNPNPMDPYLRIDTAERVELFSLTIPFAEKWWFHSQDDVGVALECGSSPTPTATEDGSGEATATPTATPVETIVEDPPTAIPTVVESATWMPPTETPPMLPTFTPVPTATDDGDDRQDHRSFLPIIRCPTNGLNAPYWCNNDVGGSSMSMYVP